MEGVRLKYMREHAASNCNPDRSYYGSFLYPFRKKYIVDLATSKNIADSEVPVFKLVGPVGNRIDDNQTTGSMMSFNEWHAYKESIGLSCMSFNTGSGWEENIETAAQKVSPMMKEKIMEVHNKGTTSYGRVLKELVACMKRLDDNKSSATRASPGHGPASPRPAATAKNLKNRNNADRDEPPQQAAAAGHTATKPIGIPAIVVSTPHMKKSNELSGGQPPSQPEGTSTQPLPQSEGRFNGSGGIPEAKVDESDENDENKGKETNEGNNDEIKNEETKIEMETEVSEPDDQWPRPRTLRSSTAGNKRPASNGEEEGGGEDFEDAEAEGATKPKRTKFRANDFPAEVVAYDGEKVQINDLASFSSVLRSYGKKDEMGPDTGVYSVQALFHAKHEGKPVYPFVTCKVPRESEEMVVLGTYVDAKGLLAGGFRGVMVLIAPLLSDFEKPDTIAWRKLHNIKPIELTGDEIHRDEVNVLKRIVHSKIIGMIGENKETDDEPAGGEQPLPAITPEAKTFRRRSLRGRRGSDTSSGRSSFPTTPVSAMGGI